MRTSAAMFVWILLAKQFLNGIQRRRQQKQILTTIISVWRNDRRDATQQSIMSRVTECSPIDRMIRRQELDRNKLMRFRRETWLVQGVLCERGVISQLASVIQTERLLRTTVMMMIITMMMIIITTATTTAATRKIITRIITTTLKNNRTAIIVTTTYNHSDNNKNYYYYYYCCCCCCCYYYCYYYYYSCYVSVVISTSEWVRLVIQSSPHFV